MWRHWNFEPASFDVKRNVAERERVFAAGRDVMVVFGRVRSTIQVATAGLGSAVAAASVAISSNVWAPGAKGPARASGTPRPMKASMPAE